MTVLHRILAEIGGSDEPCVIATIVRVEGSAYRKEGATMLIKQDGSRIGMLSGGCLEEDIAVRATELLRAEKGLTLVYDMRTGDEFGWGQGAGCNGLVHVLLEPVHSMLREHFCLVTTCMEGGVPVTCFKKLEGEQGASDYWFVPHNDIAPFGRWTGEVPDLRHLRNATEKGRDRHVRGLEEGKANVYVQTYRPKPRLIVFGAGEDARPVTAFASRIGFSVTVADWRPAYCNAHRFPEADVLLNGFPDEIAQQLRLCSEDFAVVMSHHFERDKQMLQFLLRHSLRYLGILGPRERTSRLFDGHDAPEYVRSPVGLPIGAEGPDEIAISIVAELVCVHKGSTVPKAVRT